ncbi:hypothetical protein EON66_11490, partial [archaeon]
DVLMGVDIWGRGSFGGGEWNTIAAVHAARLDAHAMTHFLPRADQLSVALFAPAWTYEACGGRHSYDQFVALERRLWHVRDERDVEAGTRTVTPLPVCNPYGMLPLHLRGFASTHSACSAGSGVGHGTYGWDVLDAGGDGWGVTQLDASDRPVADASAAFVTSYKWCSKQQVIALPEIEALDASACSLRACEWVRGTSSDAYELQVRDTHLHHVARCQQGDHATAARGSACLQYHLHRVLRAPLFRNLVQVELLDVSMHPLGAAWSIRQQCRVSREWQLQEVCVDCVPHMARYVRVTHGGQDAKGWAGHFGCTMTGMRVEWVAVLSPTRVPQLIADASREDELTEHHGLGPVLCATPHCAEGSGNATGLRIHLRPVLHNLPFK